MQFKYFKEDLSASLVVFLVALPLCLGIAVASGAPPLAGLVAGIVGGIVVGFFSQSSLSVSGPAAGLTAIIVTALADMPSFEMFLLAVVISGIIQMALGFAKAGVIGYYFPNSVIKGMLAAIGLILILKQIPHALGDDAVYEGSMEFSQTDNENTFTEIIGAFRNINPIAAAISLVAVLILVFFDKFKLKQFTIFRILPAALFAVVVGVILNIGLDAWWPGYTLKDFHMVKLPVFSNFSELTDIVVFPNFRGITDKRVYITGITIALVASIETLLSVEASDRLDPLKRITPTSRELSAQGLGNVVSGLLGGLPVTAVIVRSSANIDSGGRTKLSAILHGFWLLLSLVFLGAYLNYIPLAALAGILFVVGFKLAKPSIFLAEYQKGWDQFIPFIVTVLAILFTDLLVGIGIGMAVGLFFVIKSNYQKAIVLKKTSSGLVLNFKQNVSFLNKAELLRYLATVEDGSNLKIDVDETTFVDTDIIQTLSDFIETAPEKGIKVEVEGLEKLAVKNRQAIVENNP